MAYAGWDAEMQELIEKFRAARLPERFALMMVGRAVVVTVTNGNLFRKSIEDDIAQGPRGPRMRYGALKQDLELTLKAVENGYDSRKGRRNSESTQHLR